MTTQYIVIAITGLTSTDVKGRRIWSHAFQTQAAAEKAIECIVEADPIDVEAYLIVDESKAAPVMVPKGMEVFDQN